MKGMIKGLLLFVLGLVIGGIGGYLFMGYQTRGIMSIYYGASLLEMAVNARQIRLGKADEVLGRLDAALPPTAMTFTTLFRSSPYHDNTLWAVQRYYDENPSLPVPAELKAVLAALPPRPPTSCEIRASQAVSSQPAESPATAPAGE